MAEEGLPISLPILASNSPSRQQACSRRVVAALLTAGSKVLTIGLINNLVPPMGAPSPGTGSRGMVKLLTNVLVIGSHTLFKVSQPSLGCEGVASVRSRDCMNKSTLKLRQQLWPLMSCGRLAANSTQRLGRICLFIYFFPFLSLPSSFSLPTLIIEFMCLLVGFCSTLAQAKKLVASGEPEECEGHRGRPPDDYRFTETLTWPYRLPVHLSLFLSPSFELFFSCPHDLIPNETRVSAVLGASRTDTVPAYCFGARLRLQGVAE